MADCFGIAQVQDVLQLVEEVAQVLVEVEVEVVVGEFQVVVVKVVLDLVGGNLDEKMKVVLHPCYQERYVVPMNMR